MSTSDALRSAVSAEDWLPVQEMLLRGLNHALSNRLASLSALTILVEGTGHLDERMQRALASDAERLEQLLGLFRMLSGNAEVRREPSRLGDALTDAGALLEHHPEYRELTLAPVVESGEAEPVLLASSDGLRASVLLLLAVARGTSSASSLVVSIRGEDGWLHVTAERAGTTAGEIESAPEFAALARFAACEGGRATCAPTETGDGRATLTLPGLSRARA